MTTKDKLKEVGPDTDKGKAIVKAINDNSTGWVIAEHDKFDTYSTREYQCKINGHFCAHDIRTPKDKDGKWGEQENSFHLLIDPENKFDNVLDLYDYAMSIPKPAEA